MLFKLQGIKVFGVEKSAICEWTKNYWWFENQFAKMQHNLWAC